MTEHHGYDLKCHTEKSSRLLVGL